MPKTKLRSRRRRYVKGRKLTKRQKNEVKSMIGRRMETKFWGTLYAGNSVDLAGAVTSLSVIGQGLTDNDRIGDTITPLSLEYRYTWENPVSAVAPVVVCRTIVFMWKDDDAANPAAIQDILLVGPTGVEDVWSMYSVDQKPGFKILHDRTYTFSNEAQANVGTNIVNYHHGKIRLEGRVPKMQYLAGTLNGRNQLYLLLLTNAATANLVKPIFTGGFKLNYKDS